MELTTIAGARALIEFRYHLCRSKITHQLRITT
jgi:hypothetical protein